MDGYDCSVTKRKGCNYCLKYKNIPDVRHNRYSHHVNDEKKAMLTYDGDIDIVAITNINYCPICGKKL